MAYAQALTDWCLRMGVDRDRLLETFWNTLVKGQEFQDRIEAGLPCKTVPHPKASIKRLEPRLIELFELIQNMVKIRDMQLG